MKSSDFVGDLPGLTFFYTLVPQLQSGHSGNLGFPSIKELLAIPATRVYDFLHPSFLPDPCLFYPSPDLHLPPDVLFECHLTFSSDRKSVV